MSVWCDVHLQAGIYPPPSQVHEKFCTIDIGERRDGSCIGSHATLYFHRVADIEILVAALQKLGNDFAAAPPWPQTSDIDDIRTVCSNCKQSPSEPLSEENTQGFCADCLALVDEIKF